MSNNPYQDSYQAGNAFDPDPENQPSAPPQSFPGPSNEYTTLTGSNNNGAFSNDGTSPAGGGAGHPTKQKPKAKRSIFDYARDFARRYSSKAYEGASAPPIPLSEQTTSLNTNTNNANNPNIPHNSHNTNNTGLFIHPAVENAMGYNIDEMDSEFDEDDIDTFEKWRLILGLIFIFIAIIDWVAMSELLQVIETDYNKPLFLRYCASSGYMLIIFVWMCLKRYNDANNSQFRTNPGYNNSSSNRNGYGNSSYNDYRVSIDDKTGYVPRRKPLWRRILLPSFVTAFVGMWAGYFWYLSLDYSTATVSNTIYQAQVAFVYPLSAVVMGVAITFQKNLGVLISLTGVIMVAAGTASDSSGGSGTNTVGGILESVISTVLYAIYEVLINYVGEKHFSTKQIVQDTFYFQFWMGLWSLLTFWPFLLLFDWFEIEIFEWPNDLNAWLAVLVPLFMDLVFMGAFMSAIVLTNSFFVAMGTLLVVPVSYVADLIWHGYSLTTSAIVGSGLIVAGFLLMEIPIVKYIRKKLGIRKSTFCFSKRNRRARIAKLKRMSMQDQKYYEYYR